MSALYYEHHRHEEVTIKSATKYQGTIHCDCEEDMNIISDSEIMIDQIP